MTTANKDNYYAYNPKLQPNAHKLRYTMTKSEACLWKYVLSGRKMKSFQFRRQRPVLNYIADFMCKELNLIIEVDGATHEHADVAENDQVRQSRLENAGFHFLRFTDEDVLRDINGVSRVIEDWIAKYEDEKINPFYPQPAG